MQRNKELDMAKGIGAMLVIYGHMTTYPRIIRAAIYSFHMPLFFLVTGILTAIHPIQKDFKTYAKRKVGTILFPAFFLELLMFAWRIVKNIIETGGISDAPIWKWFLGIFLQIGYSDYSGSLWFLSTYFLTCILLYPMWKWKELTRTLTAVLLLLLSYGFTGMFPETFLPWRLEIVPACMGYILLGYSFYRLYQHLSETHAIYGGGYITVWIITWCINHFVLQQGYALDSHTFGNVLLDTVIGVSGSMTIIFLCQYIFIKMKWTSRLLTFMGENSMVFYGVQAVMVGILNTILRHFFSEELLYGFWGIPLSLLSLAVSVAVDSVFVLAYRKMIAPYIRKSAEKLL